MEHQSGKAGAKYFRGRSAIDMVYIEEADDRSSASIREAQIKKLSRREKLALIP
jgi:putative endonuclease